jgi:hypothetical protein
MTTFTILDELAEKIQTQATERGVTIDELLKSLVWREKARADRRKIEEEQSWWMNLPLSERAKYEGKYIAVHNKLLVDFDEDVNMLSLRIRAKYGNIAILIMPAEGPREISIRSLRFVSHDH